jgi:hypothetical protein
VFPTAFDWLDSVELATEASELALEVIKGSLEEFVVACGEVAEGRTKFLQWIVWK